MKHKRYKKTKKVKMHSLSEKFVVVGLILGCTLLVGFSIYTIVVNIGKNSLFQHADEYEGKLQTIEQIPIEKETTHELQEGEIYYQGEYYAYNKDLMTFLVMGIDSRTGITEKKKPGSAGQADALMLVLANPHTKEINVIAVNRDSISEIEVYDVEGGYAGTENKQITLQYAYGDGREKSCHLMEEAVSNLFYGIPIHGYVAFDMNAIPVMNDAVGGVPVTVLEDMDWCRLDWKEGMEITLHGQDSLTYIRERNYTSSEMGTNVNRIARQKQYLSSFSNKLKEKTKENLAFPISIYQDIQSHVVTSLSIDEMTYLISTVLSYEFNQDYLYSMVGELKMGEKNEEFYPDEDEMKKMIVNLFYEKNDVN